MKFGLSSNMRRFPVFHLERFIQAAVRSAASHMPTSCVSPFPVVVTIDVHSASSGSRETDRSSVRFTMPDVPSTVPAKVLPEGQTPLLEHGLSLLVEYEQTMRDLETSLLPDNPHATTSDVPSLPYGSARSAPTTRYLLLSRAIANWLRVTLCDKVWLHNGPPRELALKSVWDNMVLIVEEGDHEAFKKLRELLSPNFDRMFSIMSSSRE